MKEGMKGLLGRWCRFEEDSSACRSSGSLRLWKWTSDRVSLCQYTPSRKLGQNFVAVKIELNEYKNTFTYRRCAAHTCHSDMITHISNDGIWGTETAYNRMHVIIKRNEFFSQLLELKCWKQFTHLFFGLQPRYYYTYLWPWKRDELHWSFV